MSDESPYLPPSQTDDLPDQKASDLTSLSMLPYARLGLRLLGVMLIVDGVGAICGGLIYGLMQLGAYSAAGYSIPVDAHAAGWAMGGIPYLVAGLYLVVSGNWVLRNVFAPSGSALTDGVSTANTPRRN